MEHHLWGDQTTGYHWANLVEHASSAFLVYKLTTSLNLRGGVLAAFIFALHPVAVESVAWMSEQKNTLSGVFYLASFLAYLRFDVKREKGVYCLGLFLFFCALCTKTVTATLPAVVWCVLWWRNGALKLSRDVLPLLPWLVLGAGAGLFSAHVEHSLIGAQGADFHLTLEQKLLLCGETFWFYLGKAVWPHPLIFIYPRWSDAQIASGWPYSLTALLLVVVLWIYRRRAPGPLTIVLMYAGTLFPALGLLNVYPFLFSYVADHFQYLALIALIVPFCAVWSRWSASVPYRALCGIGAVLLCVGYAVLSARQAGLYSDGYTLYRSILTQNPSCWMAHNNLGNLYAACDTTLNDAISEYQAALAEKPDWADTHYNLANLYALQPEHQEDAVREYQKAIALQPTFAEAHNNYGKFLATSGNSDRAAADEFRLALSLDPHLAAAHANLGTLYSKRVETLGAAVEEYRVAVALDPHLALVYENLGTVLSRLPGRRAEAIASYEKALQIRDDLADAHFKLAELLAADGRDSEAIRHYERALQLEPDRAAIQYILQNLRAKSSVK